MPKLPSRFFTKLVGNLVVLGVLGIVAVKVAAPTYVTATPAEIRAIVDPRLLEPLPAPEGGKARYKAFNDAITSYKEQANLAEPLDLTNTAAKKIVEVVRSGDFDRSPIHTKNALSFPSFAGYRNLLRQALASAKLHADDHDWKRVEEDVDFAALLVQRLRASETSLMENLIDIGLHGELDRGIVAMVGRSDIPVATARCLLGLMPPSQRSDTFLAQAIRGQFLFQTLPRIPDPDKWLSSEGSEATVTEEQFGNYDAKETAKWESAIFASMLANTERKSHHLDRQWEIVAHNVTKDVPDFLAARSGSGWSRELKWQWYKLRMRMIPNSYGTIFINNQGGRVAEASLKARAAHTNSRVAVAIRVFQLQNHRNPTGFTDLIETRLLDEVPYDFLADAPLSFSLRPSVP